MISIGQFSKICSVSVKTLRYYDKTDLLKPFKVDKFTGYRYYDESQFKTMLTINRLKRYGFSLSEIRELLPSDKNSAESYNEKELFLMLKARTEDIKAEIGHKEMLVKEMETIIENFERTGKIMDYQNNYEITVKESDSLKILSSRQRMSIEDFGKYYGKLFEKAEKENLKPNGIVLAIYHDPEFDEKDSDIETGIGISEESDETVTIGGCLCATTVHKGSYANLSEAYATLVKWIGENGYKIAAAPYEIYRKSGVCSEIPVDEWETDIYFPITK